MQTVTIQKEILPMCSTCRKQLTSGEIRLQGYLSCMNCHCFICR